MAYMVKLARIVNVTSEICVTTEINEQEYGSFDDDQSDVYINEGGPLSCADIENELENDEQSTNGM